ncbi:metallophosphoesterase family protein [Bacillus niameyensis]|uniref:metallophosphoesterase family protein n=1 Tax=Bacillus niameyensis TaxID=1522308 RepID=UPI00078610C9|nr:metallophosphoesterase [Bacillus niameyensis]
MSNNHISSSKGEAVLEFFVISDFQLTIGNKKSHGKIKIGLQDLKEINPTPDALVVNGDMTDDGSKESYEKVKYVMEETFYPENTLFTIGNHEFFKNDGNEPAIKRFLDFSGRTRLFDEQIINDHPFILLGSESWGPIGAPTKDSAYLSEEQLQWLEETLEKYQSSGKPIFIFLHQPLPYTLSGTDLEYYRNGVIQDKELKRILSQYPKAILFSGHSHWDLHLQDMFLYERFAMVNSGAIYNTYGPDENGYEKVINPEGCQGLYVQVFHDEVIIKARDMEKREWINNQLVIPLAGVKGQYT